MNIAILVLYVIIHFAEGYKTQNANKTLLSDYPNALCLDGSPGTYYFNAGELNTKWVIYFVGTGWCSGIEKSNGIGFNSCYQRSQLTQGSSNDMPHILDMNANPNNQFFLNSNQSINPLLYNWNHIYVHYCDGNSFSSNLQEPIIYNNTKIYFRGLSILDGLFQEFIKKHNFLKATDIIIAGGSAGGLTVYLHSNYINDKYISQIQSVSPLVIAMPDCGFFMDYNGYNITNPTNYSNAMKWIYDFTNATTDIRCQQYMQSINQKTNLCMFSPHVASFIQMPIFALQSQYDAWQTPNILGIKNPNPNNYNLINQYGNNLTDTLKNVLLNDNKNSGTFLISCYSHCGQWDKVHINGLLEDDSFTQFYNNYEKQSVWYQNATYPCSNCCQ